MSPRRNDEGAEVLTKKTVKRARRPFYLVQRMSLSPYKKDQGFLGGQVVSNPFGYGRMGDYELDYMGAAEFEFGEIPKANNRLAEAGKDLVIGEFAYKGHVLDFLWVGKEGEPFEEWVDWAEGRGTDDYTGRVYEVAPFDGKEPPHELRQRLKGEDPPKWSDGQWQVALYWALNGNVIWGFQADGHLHKWIESMGSSPTEFLR